MRKALGILLGLFVLSPHSAVAEWRVKTLTDAMTDKNTTVAVTENAEGYTFGVFRAKTGDAWATFTLANAAVAVDTLADNWDRVAFFRIDKKPANDLAVLKLIEKYSDAPASLVMNPRAIAFSVQYDRRDKSPTIGYLREIMDGKNLLFRYFTVGGGSQDIEFDLNGAKEAIANALGIPEEPDADNLARRTILREAMQRCPTISDSKSPCAMLVSKCDKNPDFSSKALSECLRGSGK